MSLIEREQQHFLPTYKRLPIAVDRAEGMHIYTADGDRYLDFLGGIAVNSLGHAHPRVIEAIERQIRRYMHVSNFFYQDAQIEFVEELCEATGYSHAFLTNSGTEANEGAMKFARAWGHARGKRRIVGFTGGFHGRTYGVLSIMEKPAYKDGMEPFLPEVQVLPYNDVEALRAGIDGGVCAVFVEFLQGEGGVRWADPAFVAALDELRREHGFLIVADEIQAGAGRTGAFSSFERYGIRPDVVTLAKGVGGGLPLGAFLVTGELAGVWKSGQHGTTFGGNAVACAAGRVLLDELKGGLIERVARNGELLRSALEGLKKEFPELILDIRGAGGMFGVELSIPAAPVVAAMLERKVIANATSDTVVRLVPPLVFEEEHIEEMGGALRAALAANSEA